MVALIADQMHQFLKEREKERCRRLEAEEIRKEGKLRRETKRKKIAEPWTRPSDSALCQEEELLMMVSEYDYHLSDNDFQNYCSERGILHLAGQPGSRRWQYFEDFHRTKEDYLADPYFQLAEEVGGKRYRFSHDELNAGWKSILLGRARLQDGWELFSQTHRMKAK